MLAQNLVVSAGIMIICVMIHGGGSALLLRLVRSERGRRWRQGAPHANALVVIFLVMGLMVLHALEIATYGWLYLELGQFADWEHSLYFAATAFSSLGFGDVVLGPEWRIVSAFQGVIGLLLIGWSTAILVAVTARMGVFDVHRDPPGA